MNEQQPQEPVDPVERADARRTRQHDDDVKVTPEGVEQRPHGSMDATQVPKGKEHPEQGPSVPLHDKTVPHTDPDARPPQKKDFGA